MKEFINETNMELFYYRMLYIANYWIAEIIVYFKSVLLSFFLNKKQDIWKIFKTEVKNKQNLY